MNSKQVLVPTILAAVVVGSLLLYKTQQVTDRANTPQGNIATPNPSEIPATDNGTYLDQKNRFSVSYPKTFKPYPNFESSDASGKTLDILDPKGAKTHWVTISSSTSKSAIDDYESYSKSPFNQTLIERSSYESKSKDLWPLWNKIRLSDVTVNGNRGIVIYAYPTEGGAGERSWGYSTYFQVGNKIINISIYTSLSKEQLDIQKQTYDKIVTSLKTS